MSAISDPTRDMDEKSWWDLWNKTHRTKDDNDPISSELFTQTAAVINEITRKESCRVLEIGCGAGLLSQLLTYHSYHGLDISSAAIDIARQKSERLTPPAGAGFPTYETADFHDWPLPPQPYNVAVCVDAVAYFRDQRAAMAKIAQSLLAGGRLVLTTINPFVYHRIQRTPASPLREGSVSHWLSRHELHTLITSAGLEIERSYTIMPRGNLGILRWINSRRLNQAFGPRGAAVLGQLKEQVGLGQYRLVVACKR